MEYEKKTECAENGMCSTWNVQKMECTKYKTGPLIWNVLKRDKKKASLLATYHQWKARNSSNLKFQRLEYGQSRMCIKWNEK